MKFLCDRCKTRYSIADERVRGKVLKIRCKSCSHVITVREGMTDDEDGATPAPVAATPAPAAKAGGAKQGGTFTGPAPVGRGGSAPAANGSALADAFAQVMQPQRADTEPPPSALEEEWYVSLDGNQEGPYSLAEAQAWIAGKKLDDDLYCWSEGFDDWLPIDKVGHFRGLRKAAPAKPRPPVPASAKGAPRAAAAPVDSGPQPAFAATLASLEAEPDAAPAAKGKPAPAQPAQKSNGKGGGPAAGSAAATAALTSLSPGSTGSTPSSSAPASAKGGAEPKAARPAASLFDLEGEGSKPDRELPELEPDEDEDDEEKDEDLEIGEVSRVVRLPDLMAAHQAKQAAKTATGRTGMTQAIRTPAPAIARGTGGVPSVAAAAGAPDGAAADGALPALSDAALADLQPAVVAAPAHKQHAILLIAAAIAVLLIGGTIAVVVATSGSDEGAVSTGDITRYDSLGRRIDDPRRTATEKAAEAAGKSGGRTGTVKKPFGSNPAAGGTVGGAATPAGKTEIVIGPDGKPLEPLTVDEMLAVSARMSSGTRRCYERALKEDPFLKVSKITVSIVVEDSGVVSSVTLDSFATQTLGKCLTAAIRRWPFRRSPKRESFVFPLVFEQR